MSFTRFHDDPCRIKKQLQESTGPGRYILNQPGNGDKPDYMEDPFLRLQGWGGNLQTNTINLESNLKGLNMPLTRDCVDYEKNTVESKQIQYPSKDPFTEQSRTTHPAWLYKDLEQVNWSILPLNPQENTCIPFHNNLDTRILEKDNFVAKVPCIQKTDNKPLPASPFIGFGSNINVNNCSETNNCKNI